jgi:hypothetical protein
MAVGSCLSVLFLALTASSTVRGTRTNAASKAERALDADAAENSDVQFLESADAEPLPAQDGAGADSVDAFTTDLAMKEASERRSVMSQFMKNFARNMRKAVLQDSEGDMPEDEREMMLAQVEGRSPPEDNPDADYMRQQRHAHHRHMLNGGRTVHDQNPEMEQASDAKLEHPVHQPHHHRMMLNHMLNGRRHARHASYERSEDSEEQPADEPVEQSAEQPEQAPSEEPSAPLRAPDGRLVVADALGRRMPMLFSRPGEEQHELPQAKRSATRGVACSFGVLAVLFVFH